MALTPEEEQQRAAALERAKSTGKKAGQTIGGNAGAQTGKAAGKVSGAVVGGTAGAGIGGVGGAIKGGVQGAAAGGVGAIPGALAGGSQGAAKGAQKGAKLGQNIGGKIGEFTGKQAGKYAGGKIGEKGGGTLESLANKTGFGEKGITETSLGSLANKAGFGKDGVAGAAKNLTQNTLKNAKEAFSVSGQNNELDLAKKFVGGDFKGAEKALRKSVGKRGGQALGAAVGLPPNIAGKIGEQLLGSKVGKYIFWGMIAFNLFNWFLLFSIILIPPLLIIILAIVVILLIILGGPFALCIAARQIIEALRLFIINLIQALTANPLVPNFTSFLPPGVAAAGQALAANLTSTITNMFNNFVTDMSNLVFTAPGQGALTAQAYLTQVRNFSIQLQGIIDAIPPNLTVFIPIPGSPVSVPVIVPIRSNAIVQGFISILTNYITLINNQILNAQGIVDAAAQFAQICRMK